MEWTRGPIIGRGSSAAVSLASTASGDLLAVKSTDLSCSAMLQREQKILSKLSSPHIVKYLGYDIKYESDKRAPVYNILMEYVPGGTLSDIIKKQGVCGPSMIRLYTNQILQGLEYLHSHHNLVHCDIKGHNILLGTDGVKIADLGCAKFLENGAAATSAFSGTPVFMAPEVARGQEQGFPADIWSLGCTVIEMASGSNPWPELDDPVSALHKIGYSGEVPQFPEWLSEDGKDFLSKCLERDPKHRWTARQLLEHPFVGVDQLGSREEVDDECFVVRNSPTGVWDLCFWDSMQVSEASHNPIHFSNSPAAAAAERIRRLLASTTTPVLPGWTDQQNWFTVRANHTEEETLEFSQHNNNNNNNSDGSPSIHIQAFDFSIIHQEEELPSPTTINDFFDFPADEAVISTRTDIRTDPVLSTHVMDVSVSCTTTINCEKQVNKTIFPFTTNFVPSFVECMFTASVYFRFLISEPFVLLGIYYFGTNLFGS